MLTEKEKDELIAILEPNPRTEREPVYYDDNYPGGKLYHNVTYYSDKSQNMVDEVINTLNQTVNSRLFKDVLIKLYRYDEDAYWWLREKLDELLGFVEDEALEEAKNGGGK